MKGKNVRFHKNKKIENFKPFEGCIMVPIQGVCFFLTFHIFTVPSLEAEQRIEEFDVELQTSQTALV